MKGVQGNQSSAPVLAIHPTTPEPERIEQAVKELSAGRILVIPTDTVYGIAQLVTATAQPSALKEAKQRPEEKSIPLLVARVDDLVCYGSEVPSYAKKLAAEHWPGALTLVVRASKRLPRHFVAEDGSIALRMPADTITLALLKALPAPLACSSANLSGKAPATSLDELDPLIAKQVSLIIDGGSLSGGVASTVVSCLQADPRVLRPGPVTLEELR